MNSSMNEYSSRKLGYSLAAAVLGDGKSLQKWRNVSGMRSPERAHRQARKYRK